MKRFLIGVVLASFVVSVPGVMAAPQVQQGSGVKLSVSAKIKKVVKKKRPTAECEDGTSIYTTVHKGACALHGGVMQWF